MVQTPTTEDPTLDTILYAPPPNSQSVRVADSCSNLKRKLAEPEDGKSLPYVACRADGRF